VFLGRFARELRRFDVHLDDEIFHLVVGLRDGRRADARRLAGALQPLGAALFAEPNPAPVKAVLAAQGWCEAGLRLPFVPASEGVRERLAALCAELD
ncbi:dihydrodipicolinate synthase family protein, partial [Clostridioides difficile]|nr:dihydrodipicolinate synthase family protein [Clostridioides difficile]